MPLDIDVSTSELDSVLAGIQSLRDVVNSPRPMTRMIQIAGEDWDMNFRQGGVRATGRPWARVSDFTHKVRMARGGGQAGRNSSDPMLASGHLWNVVTRPFKNWPTNVAERIGATVPSSGKDVRVGGYVTTSEPAYMVASISAKGRKFQATLSGDKAMNQYGGIMPYHGDPGVYTYVPARPFWYWSQSLLGRMAGTIGYTVVNNALMGTPNFRGVVTNVPGSHAGNVSKGGVTIRKGYKGNR